VVQTTETPHSRTAVPIGSVRASATVRQSPDAHGKANSVIVAIASGFQADITRVSARCSRSVPRKVGRLARQTLAPPDAQGNHTARDQHQYRTRLRYMPERPVETDEEWIVK